MVKQKHHLTRRATLLIVVPLLFVLGVAVIAVLDYTDKTSLIFDKDSAAVESTSATSTSDQPSAKAGFNAGTNTDKTEASGITSNKNGNAVIRDTNGSTSQPGTNPVRSSSGEISVNSPTANATIQSGQTVSGASSLSEVSYRIIDSRSGVIASGKLKVVDGTFSGVMEFDTTAPEGQLDIYSERADGTEFSNIALPVRFN